MSRCAFFLGGAYRYEFDWNFSHLSFSCSDRVAAQAPITLVLFYEQSLNFFLINLFRTFEYIMKICIFATSSGFSHLSFSWIQNPNGWYYHSDIWADSENWYKNACVGFRICSWSHNIPDNQSSSWLYTYTVLHASFFHCYIICGWPGHSCYSCPTRVVRQRFVSSPWWSLLLMAGHCVPGPQPGPTPITTTCETHREFWGDDTATLGLALRKTEAMKNHWGTSSEYRNDKIYTQCSKFQSSEDGQPPLSPQSATNSE